jgi:hypothetical protein
MFKETMEYRSLLFRPLLLFMGPRCDQNVFISIYILGNEGYFGGPEIRAVKMGRYIWAARIAQFFSGLEP